MLAGKSGGARRDSRYCWIWSISALALFALSLDENLTGTELTLEASESEASWSKESAA